jgi:4a-hydroxytetrahydrobiopterin dehydratase
MDLKDKKCIPCSSYIPPLEEAPKKDMLSHLSPDWKLIQEESRLARSYKFKNFKRALEFTNEVGRIAEEEKHHPEIHLGWGHCDIEVWTHANNNLVENDFILAAKIEEAFNRLRSPA